MTRFEFDRSFYLVTFRANALSIFPLKVDLPIRKVGRLLREGMEGFNRWNDFLRLKNYLYTFKSKYLYTFNYE